MYKRYIKRGLDTVCAGVLLVLLMPVALVLAVMVRIKLGAPALFRQRRPGLYEALFDILKFRTMTNAMGPDGELSPDSQRITAFGAFLRKSSLDELPELLNVLRGEMSFVGPRPLLTKYLPYYSERERLRHTVRPGITGLAQVRGRNNVRWDKRLAYDVEYVERCSFSLDCRILFETAKIVIAGSDVVIVPDTVMQDLDVERAKITRTKDEV